MASLEDLKQGAQVRGILPASMVTILQVEWHGADVVEATYRDAQGHLGSLLLYRDQQASLEVVAAGTPWAFDGDGAAFRLVSEAYRIRMAYLFDPWMAVHLSLVEPLPHQISAVYEVMLPRQPLRFLLADDPGAGKTIMTGLLIKELMLRGDLERCLIVSPGNLTEQWQDELDQKFGLAFELLTNDRIQAARSGNALQELAVEIQRLHQLEALADAVRRSDQDRKWAELSRLLQEGGPMFDAHGGRRKLVIFTEHRDTLNYLAAKITTLLGRPESVVTIHGGILRDQRRALQAAFVQDKNVLVLIATDAAGEGINLQRAHLMVNYDLPWNPNRLEQRFGRIHRIGQTEVCHLWNLVAHETREGDVYARLLHKIEQERLTLGDSMFDVLGKLFQETSLRQLLLEAIRYGDRPEVKARLDQAVDNLADQARVRQLLDEVALVRDSLDTGRVRQIRADFERAQARRLQPHFVEAFFKAAFEAVGGSLRGREPLRYEISHVPAAVRARSLGGGPILRAYERVTFHKEARLLPGKPPAEFLAPGHPLLNAVIDLVLERYRGLLRRGALLVDPNDPGQDLRALFYLEHAIQDARPPEGGDRPQRILSRQMQFVEINAADLPRIQALLKLLEWEGPDVERTRYLKIDHPSEGTKHRKWNEYQERPVLPGPMGVEKLLPQGKGPKARPAETQARATKANESSASEPGPRRTQPRRMETPKLDPLPEERDKLDPFAQRMGNLFKQRSQEDDDEEEKRERRPKDKAKKKKKK